VKPEWMKIILLDKTFFQPKIKDGTRSQHRSQIKNLILLQIIAKNAQLAH